MAPPGRIRGPIFWQRKKIASALIVCTRRQSSTVTSVIGLRRMMPAALTRKSASAPRSATLSRSPRSARSAVIVSQPASASAGEAGRVAVDGEHRHALGGHAQGGGLADAARRAGHDPALADRTRQERPHPRHCFLVRRATILKRYRRASRHLCQPVAPRAALPRRRGERCKAGRSAKRSMTSGAMAGVRRPRSRRSRWRATRSCLSRARPLCMETISSMPGRR